ncbi:ABC transporter ATP-binding protein [Paenibacillus glycanilyticus]|uniref:Iron ABC transporter ATP-binding protein n=1 Tax=Paenibacillus glycanilyticus TaxID=126569 RepID=A0ABQ6GI84_9BACL|nr:ABC transporter ATP-binding protein [Paenibacillus glycanilyticus]GLX70215.1 iron ABC transporter ATP-binding protein [Paenibacillus glycanilyticus]
MELNRVTFAYNDKANTLQEVTASIEPGKITTIIGPNGSGKSTLLGVLSRHCLPQSGEAVLDGKAIAAYKPRELARKLAVVHQQNEAPSDITVEKLVAFGRLPHRSMWMPGGEEDDAAIEWALELTNLTSKRKSRLTEMSGGERQRVWIAMALAQRTPILFLDEPTTFLDMFYQYELLELIRKLNAEHELTIVMVLHDLNQAIRYSDYLLVMKEGKLLLQGPPEFVVTEHTMKDIYGIEVAIHRDERTGMYMVPIGVK